MTHRNFWQIPLRSFGFYREPLPHLEAAGFEVVNFTEGSHRDVFSMGLLKEAELEDVGPGSVHHSDRGCQYTSNTMRASLRERGILCSISVAGYFYDNAPCESFFATLKRETLPDNCVFETKAEARRTFFEYIETFYNRRRIHTSFGNRTPDEILTNHFQQKTITRN